MIAAETCATAPCQECSLACATAPSTTDTLTDTSSTVGAGGIAIAVLAVVLWVTAAGWVAAPAAAAVCAGAIVAGLVVVGHIRGGPSGGRLADAALRLLPGATGLLLVAFLARVVTIVT